ncbi:MAG: DUF5717 family protein [Eubacterium sp.]|nr:DUF5717 family protein [Eubacterium sp.]
MQSRLQSLAAGQFDTEKPVVSLGTDSIDITIAEDSSLEGSFLIQSGNDVPLEGYVISDNTRIEPLTGSFSGVMAQIYYRIDASSMHSDEFISGKLCLICAGFEKIIPVTVRVVKELPGDGDIKVKSLPEFFALCETSYTRARKIFYSPLFPNIFNADSTMERLLYEGLISGRTSYDNSLEEFLIACGRSKRPEFSVSVDTVKLDNISEKIMEYVLLRKDGEGTFVLRVESDADFLSPRKAHLVPEDFVGNQCEIAFTIDPSLMHAGKNLASLKVYDPFFTAEYTIEAVLSPSYVGDDAPMTGSRRKRMNPYRLQIRKKKSQLTSLCIADRIKGDNDMTRREHILSLCDDLMALDPKDAWYPLIKADVLIMCDREDEAALVLGNVERRAILSNPDVEGFYCVVSARLNPSHENIRAISQNIRELSGKYPHSVGVLFSRLRMDDELTRNGTRKYSLIRESILGGVNSPFILLEAAMLLNEEPYLVSEITDAELMVLGWSVRFGLMSREVADQVCRFCSTMTGYKKTVFRLLERIVALYPSQESVGATCSYLILNHCIGEEFVEYYRKGIEYEVRIIGLYESYLLSLPEINASDISKELRLYFRYALNLPDDRTARFLSLIIGEAGESPVVYAEYIPVIDEFASRKLKEGYINDDMKIVYDNYFSRRDLDFEEAYAFSKLIYARRFTLKNSGKMPYLVVSNPLFSGEEVVKIRDNKAFSCLISGDCTLLYQDEDGARYAFDEEIVIEDLFTPYKYRSRLSAMCPDHTYLLLDSLEKTGEITEVTASVSGISALLEADRIRPDARGMVLSALLRYIEATHGAEKYLVVFAHCDTSVLSFDENGRLIELFAALGDYEEAYMRALRFGIDHIRLEKMLFLCDYAIGNHGDNPFTLRLCTGVFEKGIYDEKMLIYMCDHYRGPLKKMQKLYRAAAGFDMRSPLLEERIVKQYLYTGTYIADADEIFANCAVNSLDRITRAAYYSSISREYLTSDEMEPDNGIFTLIYNESERLNVISDLVKAALLKWLIRRGYASIEELKRQEEILDALLSKGLYFGFFDGLDPVLKGKYQLQEICIVDYLTNDDSEEPMLNYRYDEEESYGQVPMKKMFRGMWGVALPLFPGQTIQYYVNLSEGDGNTLSGSGVKTREAVYYSSAASRYDLLNNLTVALNLKDAGAVTSTVEEYMKKGALCEEMFPVI